MSDELNAKMILGLRRFAKSVMVISCEHEGVRFAMSATAVTEVSMDPASMLICVNRSTKIFPALNEGASFCINMLRSDQEDIARNCGGRLIGEERFSAGDWRKNDGSTPYLHGAQANFFCKNIGGNSFGTHDIFIGEITSLNVSDAVDPLIYVDGLYSPLPLSKNGGA